MHRPLFPSKPKVAVLGAGISGLMCARILRDHGLDVTVFEKSRGVGGRTATRRAAHRLQFDHGAQYFTARDDQFQRYVQSWIHDGLVKRWPGRIVEIEHGQVVREKSQTTRFVATPTMNSICKHLAQDVDVRLNTKVSRLEKAHDAWQLIGEEQRILGDFDFLIVSAPAGQTATLLGDVPSIQERAASVEMHPCWAVMMAMSHPLEVDFDGAFINQGPISWIARNSSKPDRPPQQETWVIHASGPWSTAHVDDEAEATFRTLHSAFCDTVGQEVSVSHHAAHRWRFALPPKPLKERCLFDRESRVVACGDWCGGPRVEGAFLSGVAAAGRILGLANQLDAPTIPLDQTQLELF